VRFPPPTLLVVLVAGTRQHTEALREQVAAVLATIGLRLSPEKTTICHIDEGFAFLGWRIRRHQQRGSLRRYVYTYPSRKALAAVKAKVRAITGQTTNQPLTVVLHRLNWVLRGWTNYFRHGASSKTFAYLDAFCWRRVIRWLCRKHQHTGWRSICRRWLPGWRPTEGTSRCSTRARSPLGATDTEAQPSPPRGRQRPDRTADHLAWACGEPGAGPTRTPGSEVRAGETDRPRGRHRAPARPYFYLLEESCECWLVNAREVKHVPGRPKTDQAGRRLAGQAGRAGHAVGKLRAAAVAAGCCGIPARYRRTSSMSGPREKQRVEQPGEDAQIKLSVVAADRFGVSGRQMLEALIAGQRDPKVHAQLAQGRMRSKISNVAEALTGHFRAHHGYLLQMMPGRIDALGAQTDQPGRPDRGAARPVCPPSGAAG
jgi:hypothetical protein